MTTASIVDRDAECGRTRLRVRPGESVFTRYLLHTPFSHALFRAAEADALGAIPLPGPVLDLGCGTGEFAALALRGKVDAGVDLCERQLRGASRSGCYASLHHADARSLPFADGEFRTVFALSVLEHIPSPDKVVAEALRVLQPGGHFIGTVVLSDLHDHLYSPELLRRIGLGWLGRTYRRCQDRLFRHRVMLGKEEWEGLLADTGFEWATCRRIVIPSVVRWWDFCLPAAVPYRLLSGLGWPRVWHPGWFRSWASRKARVLLSERHEQGGVLLFVAAKPGEGEKAPSVGRPRLPPSRMAAAQSPR